ncbi:Arm DNA-binding domain-containing protein [Burkholderia multivorans]|uniref:Arm DNA-binding domain-containing protein n=1 Tax=Burkholderia multivorans TaxID=87883 RepID=UPI00209E2A33|nr:Arm DNA-binding domain-containing protein [Burkholderia multivorans]
MPLTDIQVRNAKASAAPYKLTDGSGMFLLVQPNGAKYWRLSYRFLGKQKTLALGVYPAVTLATARKKCDEAREQSKAGATFRTTPRSMRSIAWAINHG